MLSFPDRTHFKGYFPADEQPSMRVLQLPHSLEDVTMLQNGSRQAVTVMGQSKDKAQNAVQRPAPKRHPRPAVSCPDWPPS